MKTTSKFIKLFKVSKITGLILFALFIPVLILLVIIIVPTNFISDKFFPLKYGKAEMLEGLEILKDEDHPDFDNYFDGYFCGRIQNARYNEIVKDIFIHIEPNEDGFLRNSDIKRIQRYIDEIKMK